MAKKETEKKESPTALKGMRDFIGDTHHKYQGFFEKASEIALYYGFQPIETPTMEREEVFLSTQSEDTDIVSKEMYSLKTKGGDKLALKPEGTAPVMRAYLEHGMQAQPQPVKLYYYGSFFRHDNPQKGRYRELKQFSIGSVACGFESAASFQQPNDRENIVQVLLRHFIHEAAAPWLMA